MNYKLEELPGSMVKFTVEVPADTIKQQYPKILKSYVNDFKMDGFRKGAVPEKIVIQKIGSLRIWEESLKEAIINIYIGILSESKISDIGRPHIVINKIADQSNAEVSILSAVVPKIELPNLKMLTKKVFTEKTPPTVTDEEVEKALLELRKMRAEKENPKQTNIDDANPNQKTEKEAKNKEKVTIFDVSQLPELTEKYLKSFGPDIKDIDSLKAKIRENLNHEQIHIFQDKKRSELISNILDETKLDIPEILITYEIETLMRQYEHDLSMSGIKMSDYLSYTKKTEAELKNDMREPATRRAKTQLILQKIAEENKILSNQEKLQKELDSIKEHYKENTDFNEEHARNYLEQIYTNQAVFEYLEKLGGLETHHH